MYLEALRRLTRAYTALLTFNSPGLAGRCEDELRSAIRQFIAVRSLEIDKRKERAKRLRKKT